jgi:hypothetical protein
MIFLHHQTRRSLHCCRILEFFRKSASFTAWIGHSSAGQSCHFCRACIAFMLNFTSEAFVLMLSPKLPLTLISIIHKIFLAICHWWVIFTKQDTWQYIPKMMLISELLLSLYWQVVRKLNPRMNEKKANATLYCSEVGFLGKCWCVSQHDAHIYSPLIWHDTYQLFSWNGICHSFEHEAVDIEDEGESSKKTPPIISDNAFSSASAVTLTPDEPALQTTIWNSKVKWESYLTAGLADGRYPGVATTA